MTTFTPGNIPSAVNTIEELVAWGMSGLAEINPNVLVTTSAGTAEPVAQVQTFRFPNQLTNPERLICVAYLPLVANWRSQGKIWSNGIAEISTTALPTTFTAN